LRQTATDASIRRAAQTAKDQIAADASLSPADRESRLAQLQAALDVLSSPAKRDRYDALLLTASAPGAGSKPGLMRAPLTWAMLAAIVAIAGGLYWQYDRDQTRQRVERERIAAEQQEERRAKEFEAKRAAEKQRLLEELRAQREAEDKQRQESNEIRSAESQKKQYVADERHVPPPPNFGNNYEAARRYYEDQRQISSELRQREIEERKQKLAEDADLRRARDEVARQKRYLEQIEREDEYARARRDAASRPRGY
jgi:hypothetical protein